MTSGSAKTMTCGMGTAPSKPESTTEGDADNRGHQWYQYPHHPEHLPQLMAV